MKKFIIILLMMFLCLGNGYCGSVVTGTRKPMEDIIFYFNCDDNTDGISPQITADTGQTINIGSSVSLVTGAVGNALRCIDSDDTIGAFSLSTVTNTFGISKGRMGFYYKLETGTIAGDDIIYIYLGWLRYLRYSDGILFNHGSYPAYVFVSGYTDTSWHFCEIRWNDNSDTFGIKIDGSSFNEKTDSNYYNSFTDAIFRGDGTKPIYYDQIIISNDYNRDLYAIRNEDLK